MVGDVSIAGIVGRTEELETVRAKSLAVGSIHCSRQLVPRGDFELLIRVGEMHLVSAVGDEQRCPIARLDLPSAAI